MAEADFELYGCEGERADAAMVDMSSPDNLPRIFQANLQRLVERVVRPGLERLPIHSALRSGEMESIDAFLAAQAEADLRSDRTR